MSIAERMDGAVDGPVSDTTSVRLASPRRAAWDEPTGMRRVLRYLLLVAIALIVLFPVYTTVLGAFSPSSRVLENRLVPGEITFDIVRKAWSQGRLGRYLVNSTVVATIVTLLQMITSMLSGYAFAHLRFPGRTGLFYVFLATLLVPFEATVVVNLDTVQQLGEASGIFGGLNSLQGLAMPFLATAVGTFLVRQALLDLPRDLLDAARLDGLGHLGFIRRVAVPLVRPTLGALALFSFLTTWNQYLWPRLVVSDDDQHTVQSGLRLLSRSALDEPNLVMAGSVVAAIPIVVALVLFQRQLVRGLTAGAVKG